MAFNRPPTDISPETFFTQWLPAEYGKLREQAGAAAAPPDTTIAVSLAGEGGGQWTLAMKAGALSTASGVAADVEVAVSQTVADWRALVCGEAGAPALVPENANPMDALLAADASTKELLKDVKGTINLKVSGFNGRDWLLTAAFQGAPQPEATFAVDAETYGQMLAGALPAPQAYFAGKIAITGDTTFAMQLGMALMAKMTPTT